jgi:outer membrane protein assembly factor BamB
MKRKAIVSFVLVVLFLVSVSPISTFSKATDSHVGSGFSVVQSTVDWWPMFHHDLVHTGYSTSTAPDTNQTAWTHTTGAMVSSSPAVADGVVFVGSWDHNVYALNASTGNLVWNYLTGDSVLSSPAVADGILYVGSYDNNVYALNATTGTLTWKYKTGTGTPSSGVRSSPTVASGIVYVGSFDDKVYALNATDGTLIWRYKTGNYVESSPAVADGKVYVGSDDNNVYALNATTGAYIWSYTTGGPIFDSSPSVANEMVYVCAGDELYALNASTGAGVWSYTTGTSMYCSPANADDKIFVGSMDCKVYALNDSTGDPLWNYTTGSGVESSPAVADGKVYVGSDDNNVYALNATTGAYIWSYKTGNNVWSSPSIADGIVYVGSMDDSVYALGFIHLTVVPQWRNQKQTASSIPQGGYITLQADGLDAFSLHEAVLSTNETGTWMNETTSALLWMQGAVFGFDNFGTATYRDGVLYAPSKGDDKLYAVNASNGVIIWNTTVRQCDGSPCIDGDIVYVGECMGVNQPTPQSRAMALNRTNGNVIWQFVEPNGNSWVGSPLVNGQYVYYTTCNFDESNYTNHPGVYALNKTNGYVLWQQSVGNIVGSVAYDSGMVFISVYNPPAQYALSATTGEQIWNQTYGSSWDTSPVICKGMVVQVTATQGVWSTQVLNETNGHIIRQFPAKGSTGTPLVDNGNVFIPSNDWTMWAFNLATGTELWQTVPIHDGTLQRYMYCSPAAAGGAVYCQALNGTFYAINETDGSILWSYTMGSPGLDSLGFGSPSIGDGRVFITNDAGLYAFNIGPGSGDWPMFCHNQVHTSVSDHGVEYVRWPLTQPQNLGDASDTWVTAKFVWCNNTITSAAIAWKIYFFDRFGNGNSTDTMIFDVHIPYHEVAVTNVTALKTIVGLGYNLNITVTATDLGDCPETFNITVYANTTSIGSQNVSLSSGASANIPFIWNTSGFAYDNYTLSAYAWPVPNEKNTADNNFTGGLVNVGLPGDVDGNGRVNMGDISSLCDGFGATIGPDGNYWHKPPRILDPFSPNLDIDGNGTINMGDIVTALGNFGQHYP